MRTGFLALALTVLLVTTGQTQPMLAEKANAVAKASEPLVRITPQTAESAVELLMEDRVKEWTPQSIQQQIILSVMLALTLIDLDVPQLMARILPPDMPPHDFHHMLLREMDRRNGFDVYIYYSTVNTRRGERSLPYDALERVIQFTRPQISMNGVSVSLGANQQTNVTPGEATLYDVAITSLMWERYMPPGWRNNQPINAGLRQPYPEMVLGGEVVTALNLPVPAANELPYRSGQLSDVARRTLGYAFGAVDKFNSLHGEGPLQVRLRPVNAEGSPLALSDLQVPYCDMVLPMYQAGDQQNPRDAFLTGFMQARIDDRNPKNMSPAIGITGDCPVLPQHPSAPNLR